jgi:hypothetical protein
MPLALFAVQIIYRYAFRREFPFMLLQVPAFIFQGRVAALQKKGSADES